MPLPARLSLFIAFLVALIGCGTKGARDRFGADDPDGAVVVNPDAPIDEISTDTLFPDADPTLGGPCVDDEQCARPGVACATFKCDKALKRCRAFPDDTRCDDGNYCNGAEKCDPRVGCLPGPVIDCGKGDTCSIDKCVEETRTCVHTPRDADGDGDPSGACTGIGKDCDDHDPTVSSTTKEICGNKKDDDCDGVIDEADCISPAFGTCDTAKVIDKAGTYGFSLSGTTRTIGATCAPIAFYPRQVVIALKVTDGPKDVDIIATPVGGSRVVLATGTTCGEVGSETACVIQESTASLVRMKLRSLATGNYPVYLLGVGEGNVELKVAYLPPTAPATNVSCTTALSLLDGTTTSKTVTAEMESTTKLPSACPVGAGPLLYKIEIPDSLGPRDLNVRAATSGFVVRATVGLRDVGCSSIGNEIRCGHGTPANFFKRGLTPGTYYVSVGLSSPSDVTIEATLSPPTTAAPDETCFGAPALPTETTTFVSMKGHEDDIPTSCMKFSGWSPITTDAAYQLKVDVPSDVLIVGRPTGSDQISLGLSSAFCSGLAPEQGCSRGYPQRLVRRALPAGDYRVVVESSNGSMVSVSTFVRPAATIGPIGADKCGDPEVVIPPTGGLFVGDTTGKSADLDASCDASGMPKGGASEVIYRLDITKKGRVIIDMAGSTYTTTVSLRRGATCPGVELESACAAGFYIDNAFLDYPVDVGTYWIVVDGYSLATGSYRLDVRVAPPAPPLPP